VKLDHSFPSSADVKNTWSYNSILHTSESELELLYDWRFTANQFVLAPSPLRPTTNNFIFKMNTCGYGPYVTSSLTTEWVCRLQLLLVVASAAILRLEFRGTHNHILLSQIRDFPNLEGQVPLVISPRNRVAQLYLQAPGSLFVASYDSQACCGGIRLRLHMRMKTVFHINNIYKFSSYLTGNTSRLHYKGIPTRLHDVGLNQARR
jgi:hypothetical protein